MKLLVTGGAGFIGSNFIRFFLQTHPESEVVNLDLLTYAGNLENLAGLEKEAKGRYSFIQGDIAEAEAVEEVMGLGITHVMNFAAESHVDRSIVSAGPFIRTNVMGAQVLLDTARAAGIESFLQVSTDEVYGQLGPNDPPFNEENHLAPRSPYSASKASADLLALAAFETYGFPVIITRCSNNYGPYQFPEKVLPLMITNALEGKPLPIYGDGQNVRDWIHVSDHCRALDQVLLKGRPGRIYNIGGNAEQTNIGLVKTVLAELAEITGRPVHEYQDLITFVKDRPGHDRRYAVDDSRIRTELGFKPSVTLNKGLALTAAWYLVNRGWWERVKSGAYQRYYEEMYGGR